MLYVLLNIHEHMRLKLNENLKAILSYHIHFGNLLYFWLPMFLSIATGISFFFAQEP